MLWQVTWANGGDTALPTRASWVCGPCLLTISLGKPWKTSLFLSVLLVFILWSFHINTLEWGEGGILLKVHSWAKNRTPASCLSAHFWTMLPQEGTFENSNSLPPCNQAVHKHMIDEWSWLSDSALGWLPCESGPESWVVRSTISLNKTLKPRSLPPRSLKDFRDILFCLDKDQDVTSSIWDMNQLE